MAPLVSVIIPVYNVLPYLREALDSVINQTYRNLEIIIVDDGSMDGSDLVCDEYKKDARVNVIHQENRGLSGARNTGLNLITGEYITFLDPDDAFCLDMIEKLMSSIFQYDAKLAVCGYDIRHTDGELTKSRQIDLVVLEKKAIFTPQEALNALIEGHFSTPIWNKVFAVEIWKNLRFPEKAVYEDLRVLPYVLERSERTVVIPQILIHQRKRQDSITQTCTKKNIQDLIDAYRLFQEFIEDRQSVFPKERQSFLRGTIIRSLILFWARYKKQGASKEVLDILKKEIYKLANQTDRIPQLKSKAVWWFFRWCPQMLLPFQTYICKIKSIFRKGQGVTT